MRLPVRRLSLGPEGFMIRHKSSVALMGLFLASVAVGQQSPAMDPEACARHCRQMAASREKAVAERQAAWKEIEAQLQAAKNAPGEKKVAALESVLEMIALW